MKRILIFILILIPMLSWAFGTKPATSMSVTYPDSTKIYTDDSLVVTGTVTATIDSADTRKTISIDVIPDPDSSKTRKMLSIDVLPAITGAVTTSGTATVSGDIGIDNFTDQEPVFRDSLNTGSIAATDTVEIVMGTGMMFNHVKGFYRASWKTSDNVDSIKFEYRFVHGTYALTRWLPMYSDTNRTDGAAVSYVVTTATTNTWVAGVPYWALLYDPASTSPMGCIPKAQDKIEFRIINLGSTVFIATWFTVWQEN